MERLNLDQKKIVLARIKELDPHGEIVTLMPDATYTRGTVAYNRTSGVVFGEDITKLTDEECVRAYLTVRLAVELKYPLESLEPPRHNRRRSHCRATKT